MAKGNLKKLAANVAGKPRELKFTVASGDGANTNIAISGIKRNSLLVSVIEIPTAAVVVDRTAATSITSDGNIQCTASTSGNQVLVVWYA
jgi:sugar (pentulose or hexulose) kinase